MFLNCKNLSFKYNKSNQYILKNIYFEITDSGFHSLFGPSGAGKSTLAKIIAGEMIQSSGEINYCNINKVIYTYNQEKIPGWYSIKDHYIKVIDQSKINELFQIVKDFGMWECLNSRYEQLSLGQKNRANLIRYLFQDFDLMIMDESLANVDEKTRQEIISIIKQRFTDKSFLYISHNLQEVVKFCKEIYVIRNVHINPQIKMVDGLNLMENCIIDKDMLDARLLEILNA